MAQQLDSPPLPRGLKLLFGLLIGLGIATIPIGGWYVYEHSAGTHWIGGYQLQIDITSMRTIREVRSYAAFRQTEAEIAAHDPHSWNELHDRVKPYVGSPIEARVNTSGRTTRSGRDISRGQDHWLAVVAEFDDGTRVGKVIEIPDMLVAREVRIEFP